MTSRSLVISGYCSGNEIPRFTWYGGIDDVAVIGGFIETALPDLQLLLMATIRPIFVQPAEQAYSCAAFDAFVSWRAAKPAGLKRRLDGGAGEA